MKLIAQVKLTPIAAQADALLRTLEAANAACDAVSELAWNTRTFKKFDLQKLCYLSIRETYGLSSQLAIRVIAKVGDAYKLDTTTVRTFRRHGSIAYDDRILSWALPGHKVSIWTLDGRLSIPFLTGERQLAFLAYQHGESDLVYRKGEWYLLATCDIPEPTEQEVDDVLGVDLGIVNLATDSDGESYTGKDVERKRQWYAGRKKALQAVGTKSAKRRLRQLSGRQRRYQKDVNHGISKNLVAKAERTKRAIGLEELTHIRQRARVTGPTQRARHSNWGFAQLRACIAYKAKMAGVTVRVIDPAYTSQTCHACGHRARANRRSQAEFCCVKCGHRAPADYNAVRNIRERAAVIQPMVSIPTLRRSG
ncbi:IS605 family transposase OrfB [Oscillochloris trichoides DG-6]|uniref:IS605 family transposase OrfB n=1 Tax=Oscillochloris trichoides DG-6 TaxID=765420 RepID=E1I9L7_9CHLR|nr:RNA-guided endonuclease TnpB family protein [Oscillochloris trichoides]EFO82095.1 IS605 family transposase OrfB [Oscillochloris trichoides DG-6]